MQRFLYKYAYSELIYTTHHIFPVITIIYLVNQDGELNTPHKMTTGTEPSVSNIRVLFCACFVLKATAHTDAKALHMRHKPQKCFVVS